MSSSTRFGLGRKIAGIFLSTAMAVSAFTGLGGVLPSVTEVSAASAADYGLMDTCQDGVILHAWQWSFNNIKAIIAKIAEAGPILYGGCTISRLISPLTTQAILHSARKQSLPLCARKLTSTVSMSL